MAARAGFSISEHPQLRQAELLDLVGDVAPLADLAETVPLVQAIRHVNGRVASEVAKETDQQRAATDSIDVVVTVDDDSLPPGDRRQHPVDVP